MTNLPHETSWSTLLRLTLQAIDTLPENTEWSWGGGTALSIHLNHRLSLDIDIFFTDASVLNHLSPNRNPVVKMIAEKWQEPSHYIKLERDEGEIDFIVATLLTEPGKAPYEFEGRVLPLETVSEILAKKLKFRGSQALARDIFDLAAAWRLDPNEFFKAANSESEGAQRVADFIMRKKARLTRELPQAIKVTEGREKILGIDLLDLADVLTRPQIHQ